MLDDFYNFQKFYNIYVARDIFEIVCRDILHSIISLSLMIKQHHINIKAYATCIRVRVCHKIDHSDRRWHVNGEGQAEIIDIFPIDHWTVMANATELDSKRLSEEDSYFYKFPVILSIFHFQFLDNQNTRQITIHYTHFHSFIVITIMCYDINLIFDSLLFFFRRILEEIPSYMFCTTKKLRNFSLCVLRTLFLFSSETGIKSAKWKPTKLLYNH